MAPSVRGSSSRVGKRQPSTRANSKDPKAKTISPAVQSKLEEIVLKPLVITARKTTTHKNVKHASKRKHDEMQEDSEPELESTRTTVVNSKKVKVQLLTPPSSQRQSPVDLELSPTINFRQLSLDARHAERAQQELPPTLQDLVSLHAAFLKAFALHIVHNGQASPANLDSLMSSVTRLWKKFKVTKEDIQRILAIYELDVSTHFSGRLLNHQEGPFKLATTGSDYIPYTVEYVGWGSNRASTSRWNEYNLQQLYEAEVEALWIASRTTPTCWVHGDVQNFPKVAFAMDVETQINKAKAGGARSEILGLSSQAQNRIGAQFAVPAGNNSASQEAQKPEVVKSRTLSLLDRVRAKAAASASTASEAPEAVLRRYAVGRIAEVVEILRMKQQRKLSSSFMSSVHSSPSKVRCKVSFSVNQLMDDIRGSLKVPLGDTELKMCFKILQDEIPGMWLSTYTIGTVQSVTLNGAGPSGVDVKRILQETEKTC